MTHRIVAFMPVYNEADILAPSVGRLATTGVSTYILDNWSTDGSWEIAQRLDCNVIGVERVPRDLAPTMYSMELIRDRIAELAGQLDAEWYIWNDADEYIHPLRGTITETLYEMAAHGWNAVEQLVATFPPIDNAYKTGTDFVSYFRHWRPQRQSGARPWIRIWRATSKTLRFRGGNHEIDFEGRSVAPVPFVLRHYPLRSQQHATRKIFNDRLPRFSAAEREHGWHTHYDDMRHGQSFLENPRELHELDEHTFVAELLAALGRAPI